MDSAACSRRFLFLLFLAFASAGVCDARPRIYIYPEDPQMMAHSDFHDLDITFYGLDMLWYQLLKESPYVEHDPEKADYFYLPIYLYWRPPGKSADPDMVAAHLRSVGPWFDRKKGADHLFIVTGDFGRCEWGGWGVMRNATMIHHFGKVYNGNEPRANPCNPLTTWGDECDAILGQFQRIAQSGLTEGYQPCHFSGQDIVVPPSPWERPQGTRFLNPDLQVNRSTLIFFAGPTNSEPNKEAPWDNALYSFGVRQSFVSMFRNHPEVKIYEKHIPDYQKKLTESIFCLAAGGWGWGGRMKISVIHGCIPVIVQDGIRVEFEEQLPLQEYALRIPLWLLNKLPEILELLIREGKVAKMQNAMECAWRLHWWSRPHGRAFELVMCELKRRLYPHGFKIILDTDACTLKCGDSKVVRIMDVHGV